MILCHIPNRFILEPAGTGHGSEPNRTEPRRVRKEMAEPRRTGTTVCPNRTEPNRLIPENDATEPNRTGPFLGLASARSVVRHGVFPITCIYIYIHTYLHIYNCMCYMCIIYIYIIVCVYIYIYIYTHIHTSHPRLPRRLQVPDEDAALGHDLEATAKVA